MGSFDGAEVCELVGLFILNTLEKRFGKDVGLYRDDGLAALRTTSGRLADKARKELITIFESFGLRITAQTNIKCVNFLDLTLDLSNGKYKPYRKPNDEPLYINRLSNHPPSITRQLPHSVNKRVNKLSCDEETFNAAAPLYNNALKQSNFDVNLTYTQTQNSTNNSDKRNRQRNITWYNPPYSKNVKTNVAQTFLNLIDKHFPPSNKLHKLFNRHTVRVSYSCMTNMKNLICKHNRKILNRNTKRTPTARVIQSPIPTVIPTPTKNDTPMCNCQKPANCPLGKKCLTESIVYKAEVTTSTANNQEKKIYIGMTAGDFKTRYRNHTKSFRHEEYKSNTELSKYVWKLKSEKSQYTIKWSVMKKVKAYKPGSKRCNLCLEEKLLIMKAKKTECLNKRSDLFSKCRHVTRHLLNQVVK